MPAKQLIFDQDALQSIRKGVNTIHRKQRLSQLERPHRELWADVARSSLTCAPVRPQVDCEGIPDPRALGCSQRSQGR